MQKVKDNSDSSWMLWLHLPCVLWYNIVLKDLVVESLI